MSFPKGYFRNGAVHITWVNLAGFEMGIHGDLATSGEELLTGVLATTVDNGQLYSSEELDSNENLFSKIELICAHRLSEVRIFST